MELVASTAACSLGWGGSHLCFASESQEGWEPRQKQCHKQALLRAETSRLQASVWLLPFSEQAGPIMTCFGDGECWVTVLERTRRQITFTMEATFRQPGGEANAQASPLSTQQSHGCLDNEKALAQALEHAAGSRVSAPWSWDASA